MTKYVYLYKITLKKKRQRPLYYFGIRTCSCLPEEDSYMGSPATYADLWKDESYVKTKEILKCGVYEDFFETFRDEETELIKESWEKYGLYGKDKKGSCLNCHSGKVVHPFFMTGENSPSKRPEVRVKLSKARKVYLKNNPDKNPMMNPESRAKLSKARKVYLKDNPDKNPMMNPESRAKMSKSKKQYHKDNPDKNPMMNPDSRIKLSKSKKQYYKNNPDKNPMMNPDSRIKLSKSKKQYYKNNPDKNPMMNPESRAKMSKSLKQYYKNNPDKHHMRNPEVRANLSARCISNNPMKNPETIKKMLETRRRNKMLRLASQKTTQPLEDFFQ